MKKKLETGLIVSKNNLYTKIKRFFFTIFFQKEAKALKKIEKLQNSKKHSQKIIIPEDIEKNRLLEIQEKYKKGIIKEAEICIKDVEKLVELYELQNSRLKTKIREYKKIILENKYY